MQVLPTLRPSRQPSCYGRQSVPEKWFEEGEFEELASELRQAVGREFRWEAEDVEQLTDQQRRRRRSLTDAAHEAMSRGDTVILGRGEKRHRGMLIAVHTDLAVLDTGMGTINAHLSEVVFTVAERARQGGTIGDRGARSFQGRLGELEHTGETVIVEGEDLELNGRIAVAAADHITLLDTDGQEWFVPYQAIWFVIQPRG